MAIFPRKCSVKNLATGWWLSAVASYDRVNVLLMGERLMLSLL